ncbi:hypothetical protein BJY27_004927 [Streptomyces rapamycinicus]|uniref:Uncharacterized protein n=2 Tax=Streptomyces rapamycinicus TaxID=1226757 RepID=A0A3L8RMA0_STRRN|nr:hypothetical protein [Streptomyces rapamycinicus]RLV80549.1 hypothetical protein D3C57_119230 [Streptomyces rapamycinicus NRRL 5491]
MTRADDGAVAADGALAFEVPQPAVAGVARTVLTTRPSAVRAVTRVSGAMMIGINGLLPVERLMGT